MSAQVIAALPPGRALAYTSVSTVLRILEGKCFVSTRREGRGHIYIPALSKHEYEARAVKDVVTACSRACPWPWCASCWKTCGLSDEDLRELAQLVNRSARK